jgi:transcriptional regulator with XRE-family HTH domain
MTREEFSEKMVKCRENAGCGKNELCRRTGFTFNQLQYLETAANNFNMNLVIRHLKAIECQMSLKNDKTFTVNKYQDIIDWLVKSRKPDYTQRSLAESTGCSQKTIVNIESGRNIVGIDIFLRLAEALGFTVELKSKTE